MGIGMREVVTLLLLLGVLMGFGLGINVLMRIVRFGKRSR